MTAAARPIAGMSWDLNYWGADQFMPGLVYRSPHWFIPLLSFSVLDIRQVSEGGRYTKIDCRRTSTSLIAV